MFDWIPLENYKLLYYLLTLGLTFQVIIFSLFYSFEDERRLAVLKIALYAHFIFSLFYIGFRPLSGKYFIDMATYNRNFNLLLIEGLEAAQNKDYLFQYFTYLCTKVMTADYYFFVLAILYIVPIYYICVKFFKNYAFYGFLMMVGSLSFWAYGTNGMRNGIATSLFLLVFLTDKWWLRILIILLSTQLHSSIAIPAAALIVFSFIKNPKWAIYGWLACIPVSLVFGQSLQEFFSVFITDDRSSYLTSVEENAKMVGGVFRWDFLIYSFSAVYAGWYFIYQKGFKDNLYNLIFGTYLISNSLWIIVIRANFSNRFAYLSWFLIGLVIFYPMLKNYQFKEHYRTLGILMFMYYSFTFGMEIFL